MSLKKKIVISFLISASIIAILIVLEYVNSVEISKEIRYLELTDTIRSKSLQLRRHEKNFFLYSPQKGAEESGEVHRYLRELDGIVEENLPQDKTGGISRLQYLLKDYRKRFDKIESDVRFLRDELAREKALGGAHERFIPLVELTFYERPLSGAEYLEREFRLQPGRPLTSGLRELDREIAGLRKDGEDIISLSKELDSAARTKVDRMITVSQAAMVISFPLFLLIGVGTLFFIVSSVTRRLKVLTEAVERTGKGSHPYTSVEAPEKGADDEVGLLIRKFNDMEDQLAQREKELLHAKKLAAIGTLASGVAHELNNPLNNIYISAQILAKEAGDGASPVIKEVVGDIVGQTARVKRIVGDLLEYARGREPQVRRVDLNEIIRGVHRLLGTTVLYDVSRIRFRLDTDEGGVFVMADAEQVERVFINLFMNAIDAMSGEGDLTVELKEEAGTVNIKVSDTGKGIRSEDVEKVFEPFYTTKDKGTGLGLAIVFNIVKKHGGEIAVWSEPGKGTTFTITLPRERQ